MSTSVTEAAQPAPPRPFNPSVGMQFVLVLEILIRMFIWSAPLAATIWFARRFHVPIPLPWSEPIGWSQAWTFSQGLVQLIVIYNVGYVLLLLALRTLIPNPRAGKYPRAARRPDPALIWSLLLAILTKARYQAPFPAFLVPHLANIAPFFWLFRWKFGPHSRSPFFVEPHVLDPTWITIGRNVTIGFGSIITGHLEERDTITIAPTIIEDDVLIGGNTAIPGNVHIKRGAVIRGYSLLVPGTVVGENEYWGGIPARRIKRLDEPGAATESSATEHSGKETA